ENSEKIRNILIISCTGNGKSSLANSMFNKEGDFKQIFKEGIRGVIDTIGLGDTCLTNKKILYSIAETIGKMKEVNHLLFVMSGRFSPEEKETFGLIKKVMFESNIENKKIREIIEVCNGFIHINNRPLEVDKTITDENEKNWKIHIAQLDRKRSKQKINDYISKNSKKEYDTIVDKMAVIIFTEVPLMIIIGQKNIYIDKKAQSKIPSSKESSSKESLTWCQIL
ncbi:10069_t:CDS:2, partial [Cetraspora pellucida]